MARDSFDPRTVHRELDVTEQVELEAGRHHHDIGRQVSAGLQKDSVAGEGIDLVRDDRDRAAADRFEQVAVGDHADALVPHVVARREMPVDIEVWRQPLANHSNQPLLRQCRPPPGKLKNRHADENVLRSEQWVGDSRRQPAPQRCRHGVHRGQVEHIGGRALQHGDVGGALRHFRNQGDRGGAAADDDYLLARVVQLLGPELRMHDRAFERPPHWQSPGDRPTRNRSSRCRGKEIGN